MMNKYARQGKNTLFLYFRQILIMLVSLYTVRVVLETLGAEDYGIYNTAAGLVTMFGFLSGSMANAGQRYFSIEIGRNNFKRLNELFGIILLINVIIAAAVLLLAETAGLWFVHNKLKIPAGQNVAAEWVYHCSILSFLFTIITTPYMALILAHEDMGIYARLSIIEALLKLAMVFLLKYILLDKLKLYGMLMSAVSIINTFLYCVVCGRRYSESRFRFFWDREMFSEITVFTGWNLFGAGAFVVKKQLIDILLNQFFNPVIVGVRNIAYMVTGAAQSLSSNLCIALEPGIIKSYAADNKPEMTALMYRGTKGIFFLMYLFVLPMMLEMPLILTLWLKNIPEFLVLFTRLGLLEALVSSVSYTMNAAIMATGRMKQYQLTIGIIILLNFPFSFIALLPGGPPYSVMIVGVCLSFMYSAARLLIAKVLTGFSILDFLIKVILPLMMMAASSACVTVLLWHGLTEGIFRLVIITAVSLVASSLFMYLLGISKNERYMLKKYFANTIFKRSEVVL